jgi:hypothetical protein
MKNKWKKTPMNMTITAKSKKELKAAAVAHSLTQNQKKEVKKLILPKIETKYVSDPVVNSVNLSDVPLTIDTASDFNNVIPGVAQGNGQNQRSGNKISNCRINCHWTVMLNSQQANTQDMTVKIFLLESKRIKSELIFATIPPPDPGRLLNRGDGTFGDWNAIGTSFVIPLDYDKQPVNSDDWIVKKVFKRRLLKNDGKTQYEAAGVVPNLSTHPTSYDIRCSVNYPVLTYDNAKTPSGSYAATNKALVYYIVAFNSQGTAIPPEGNFNPLYTFRSDMHYKDG